MVHLLQSLICFTIICGSGSDYEFFSKWLRAVQLCSCLRCNEHCHWIHYFVGCSLSVSLMPVGIMQLSPPLISAAEKINHSMLVKLTQVKVWVSLHALFEWKTSWLFFLNCAYRSWLQLKQRHHIDAGLPFFSLNRWASYNWQCCSKLIPLYGACWMFMGDNC